MPAAKEDRRKFTQTRAAITAVLDAIKPQGLTLRELMQATNRSECTIHNVAPRMAREGECQVATDPGYKAGQRKRYFALGCDPVLPPPPPRKVVEPKPRAQKAMTVVAEKPARRSTFRPDQEVVRAPGFKLTRCPGFERVTDAKVKAEPYFSALAVGSYPASDTHLSKVYGG